MEHISSLYAMAKSGKYIMLGGNQGNTLRFSDYGVTSDYIKGIGYMHLEGFYFPANYNGPHLVAPTLQSAAKLNQLFGIIASNSNSTQ